jgi:hypothetical protein
MTGSEKSASSLATSVAIMRRQLQHISTHYSPVTERMLLSMLVCFAGNVIQVLQEQEGLLRHRDRLLLSRDMNIVRMREDGFTLKHIGLLYGLSYERVRQILKAQGSNV